MDERLKTLEKYFRDESPEMLSIASYMLVVLALILSIAILPAALVAEARASEYINSTYASITATGNGNLKIGFSITGTGTMTSIGATRIDVKNSSGTTVKIFYSSNPSYANMMGGVPFSTQVR